MNLSVAFAPQLKSKQKTSHLMAGVLIALSPTVFWAIICFGLSALWLLLTSVVACILFEILGQKIAKRPLTVHDLSAVVTGLLLGLNLPAAAPIWLPIVGGGIAILLVKQLFGGLGCNFLNPALAARAVLLASWPTQMSQYVLPAGWGAASVSATTEATAQATVDAVSTATPLGGLNTSLYDLFMGRIPGAMGEICKLAILLGLLYLLFRKIITWHVPISYIGSFMLLTWAIGKDPFVALCSGGILFGAVYMATDYVTNPMTRRGQLLFGIGCGLLTFVIRNYASYDEGVTYAILLMNICTPLIDRFLRPRVYGYRKRRNAA